MKKIDKLIFGSFLGPFFLTFFVVIFILLSQFMLKYFDELVGKDLDGTVIAQLIFYFSIFMTPNAFPLAVLLSSLMTFGNLGEHFELTALKGSGISLVRALAPIFVFSLFLTVAAYYSNNYLVPKANLQAFSLLYDVKQMKPSMELKEGAFYNGIEGYSIKVNKKFPDDKTLKDIIIYNHTKNVGNNDVILADSGQMYNILDGRYMVLELFEGNSYSEQKRKGRVTQKEMPDPFVRNEFARSKMVFDLTSFGLKRTKQELFASNRLMKNSNQLKYDTDSMEWEYADKFVRTQLECLRYLDNHMYDVKKELQKEVSDRSQDGFKRHFTGEKSDSVEYYDGGRKDKEDSMRLSDKKPHKGAIREEQKPNPKMNVASRLKSKKNTNDTLVSKSLKQKIESGVLNKKKGNKKKDHPKKEVLAAKSKDSLNTVANVGEINVTDSLTKADSVVLTDSSEMGVCAPLEGWERIDSLMNTKELNKEAMGTALGNVRHLKSNLMMQITQLENLKTEWNKYLHERFRKLSSAVTILVMFLIGAPLGSIIKRGGLGMPVLISICFFILFYVISMICEKWTRQDVMDPFVAAWMANIILFPVGLFFLRQAKNDARLLDMDFYNVMLFKVKGYFKTIYYKLSNKK